MRSLSWIVTFTVCAVVAGLLGGIKYFQVSAAMAMAAEFPPPYSVVATANVVETQWTPVRRLTGTVRAPNFINVTAEATGKIVALPIAAGEIANKGEILLQLFNEDLKAQRVALEADLNLVLTQLERVESLMERSLASQDQLDTLVARHQSLRAQIAAIDAQLSRLTIYAPFDGRLGIYVQSVGDLMQSGETLTTFTGVGATRWVDFKIPQGVARVAPGDRVKLFSIDREPLGEATIIAVADALSAGLRAYEVRASLEAASLRHGELVLVEVQTSRPSMALELPGHAVRWDVEGPHVFVLNKAEDGAYVPFRAERRNITVLGDLGGTVLAVGELVPGEMIATDGAFKLSDGSLAKRTKEQSRG